MKAWYVFEPLIKKMMTMEGGNDDNYNIYPSLLFPCLSDTHFRWHLTYTYYVKDKDDDDDDDLNDDFLMILMMLSLCDIVRML